MKLIIEDDEGRKTVVPLVRDEITIGRQEGNTILTERNLTPPRPAGEGERARLIEDLGSYNGVRSTGRSPVDPDQGSDLVEIGDYDLGIKGKIEARHAGERRPVPALPPARALKARHPPASRAAPRASRRSQAP
jgi:hypothetical protein